MKSALGGAALVCAGVFLGLSLISWDPHDPQLLPNSPVFEHTSNICGVLGARLSSYAYATHGLAAFGVAGWLVACGAVVFKESAKRARRELASSAALVAWLSVALQFLGEHAGERVSGMCPLGPGGAFGLWPAAAMLGSLGWAGTAIALSASFVALSYLLGGHKAALWLARLLRRAGRVAHEKPRPAERAGKAAAPPRVPQKAPKAEKKAPAPLEIPVRVERKPAPAAKKPKPKKTKPPAPTADGLPPLSLLEEGEKVVGPAKETLEEKGTALVRELKEFGIECDLVTVECGPTVTTFELRTPSGVKIEKIDALATSLAVKLKSMAVRLVAPIPGKDTIGIELPNPVMHDVHLRTLLETEEYRLKAARYSVPIALGMDSSGAPLAFDLAEMPHLLVAGATNTGKSVCLNAIILSILMQRTRDQVSLMIVDPKQIELSIYEGIPHLMAPVVSNTQRATTIFDLVVRKMEERYELLSQFSGIRDVAEYNRTPRRRRAEAYRGEGDVLDLPDSLPHIVVVVDEFQDIIRLSSSAVEGAVQRLSQKARAAGIHLVLATQRPSVDVLTGTIKANITARLCFQVAAPVDSRTVFDRGGAEKLLGKGDMLVDLPTQAGIIRGRCAYVTADEAGRVVEYLKEHGSARSDEAPPPAATVPVGKGSADKTYEEACRLVLSTGQASPTMLQSRLGIGYARAGKLIDAMAREALVTPWTGGRPRQVCMTVEEWEAKRKSPAA